MTGAAPTRCWQHHPLHHHLHHHHHHPSDEHEEEDEEEISIHGDVAVYLYQVRLLHPRHLPPGVCLRKLRDESEVQDFVPELADRRPDAGLRPRLRQEVQIPRLLGLGTTATTIATTTTCQDLVWVHEIPNVPISPQPWVPPP